MISLKSMHTSSFIPSKHALFNTRGLYNNRAPTLLLSMCKATDNSDSDDSEQPPPPQGDSRQQEMLVQIARLQTQKVRLTDYLDEKSKYLTQFAEEANAEFDKVGEDALKDLDEATARIMGTIESQMQEFEESTEMNKAEIEEKEKELVEFEGQIEDGRNEGLALIGLLVIGIADSFVASSSPWPKAAVLGVILVGLFSQLICKNGTRLTCSRHPLLRSFFPLHHKRHPREKLFPPN